MSCLFLNYTSTSYKHSLVGNATGSRVKIQGCIKADSRTDSCGRRRPALQQFFLDFVVCTCSSWYQPNSVSKCTRLSRPNLIVETVKKIIINSGLAQGKEGLAK